VRIWCTFFSDRLLDDKRVMERDAKVMRRDGKTIFTQVRFELLVCCYQKVKHDIGVDEIVEQILEAKRIALQE